MTRPPIIYRFGPFRGLMCAGCSRKFLFGHRHRRYREHLARRH